MIGRLLALTVIVLLTAFSALAQQAGYPGRNIVAIGYCQITSLGSAVSVVTANCASGTVPAGATLAVVTVETAAVRWRADGTAPTASVGMLITPGQSASFYLSVASGGNPITPGFSGLQFIAQSGSPVVDIAFFQ